MFFYLQEIKEKKQGSRHRMEGLFRDRGLRQEHPAVGDERQYDGLRAETIHREVSLLKRIAERTKRLKREATLKNETDRHKDIL